MTDERHPIWRHLPLRERWPYVYPRDACEELGELLDRAEAAEQRVRELEQELAVERGSFEVVAQGHVRGAFARLGEQQALEAAEQRVRELEAQVQVRDAMAEMIAERDERVRELEQERGRVLHALAEYAYSDVHMCIEQVRAALAGAREEPSR